ncbi:uncharacterized protein LOC127757365 [Oryza glaberrima]|uniref:uncharacterized protein LOC127757365 n=1 Tax=Oryza glaberrima TaxID=4538 RepID=UPI00224C2E7B|nr:uncharacterized protein LOC127757365 [Oryza glaberrima]
MTSARSCPCFPSPLRTTPSAASSNAADPSPTFPTRLQQVGLSAKNRRAASRLVWESGERYTLEAFRAKAAEFEPSRHATPPKNPTHLQLEALFWAACTSRPFSVEYGNDMPGCGFASPDRLRFQVYLQFRVQNFRHRLRKKRSSNVICNSALILFPSQEGRLGLLVTAPGLGQYISGAILFEETLYQYAVDGRRIVDVLAEQGIVPGIKVDKGPRPAGRSDPESWCQGLDGLALREAAYYPQGARFAKWRTVVSIPNGPSALAVKEAAWGLARYAAISQLTAQYKEWWTRSSQCTRRGKKPKKIQLG